MKSRNFSRRAGFTLIELLTVIAIIGVLAAIIIPTVGAVRAKAAKAKTKAQFSQWSQAVELFRQEYGYYPRFLNDMVNGAITVSSTGNASGDDLRFQELLSGKPGNPPSTFVSNEGAAATVQNKKHLPFYSFDASELTSTAASDKTVGAVRDAFGNVEIAIICDRNGDGLIKTGAAEDGVFPNVTSVDGGILQGATIATDIGANGLRAKVIIYSAGRTKSNDSLSEAVLSWQ